METYLERSRSATSGAGPTSLTGRRPCTISSQNRPCADLGRELCTGRAKSGRVEHLGWISGSLLLLAFGFMAETCSKGMAWAALHDSLQVRGISLSGVPNYLPGLFRLGFLSHFVATRPISNHLEIRAAAPPVAPYSLHGGLMRASVAQKEEWSPSALPELHHRRIIQVFLGGTFDGAVGLACRRRRWQGHTELVRQIERQA